MIEDDWVYFTDYEDLSDIEPMVANDPEVIFHDNMTEMAQDMQLAFHIADVSGPMTKEAADGLYTSRFQRPKVRPNLKPKKKAESSSSKPVGLHNPNPTEAQPDGPQQAKELPTSILDVESSITQPITNPNPTQTEAQPYGPQQPNKQPIDLVEVVGYSTELIANLSLVSTETQPNGPQQPKVGPIILLEAESSTTLSIRNPSPTQIEAQIHGPLQPILKDESSNIQLVANLGPIPEAQPVGPQPPNEPNERPTGLPEGWDIKRTRRKNGKSKGVVDKVIKEIKRIKTNLYFYSIRKISFLYKVINL